jgi:glycerophosphoryl diester phosphodiesterase
MANLGLKENKMMKIRIIKFIIIPLALLCVHIGCIKEESGKNNLIDFRDTQSIKSQKPILIAHRGGVITAQSPECSIAAIRLAKQQDYAMVELDIQKSKDHVPTVFHDNDMKKACGIDKSIKDLNADEIVKISYVNTDQTICTLDQALSICRSLKLGLMLDVKITGDEEFFQKIATIIKKHGYENSSVTINGDPDLRKHLEETALLTVTQDEFTKVQQGLSCDLRNKFWFGLPHMLPSEMVKLLQQNGAYVIPAINTFRYPDEGHYELARKDIQRLNEAGVDGYQIDSVYQPLFLEKKREK